MIESILLVDDDKTSCYVANRILKRAQIASLVLTVHSGLEALLALQEHSVNHKKLPDIILLDLNMPRMDGFEFLGELAKQQNIDLSYTKIFILTSSSHPRDKEKAASSPISVSGFLTKPITQEILSVLLQ